MNTIYITQQIVTRTSSSLIQTEALSPHYPTLVLDDISAAIVPKRTPQLLRPNARCAYAPEKAVTADV